MELLVQVVSEWSAPSISVFLLGMAILGYQLKVKEALDRIEQEGRSRAQGESPEIAGEGR